MHPQRRSSNSSCTSCTQWHRQPWSSSGRGRGEQHTNSGATAAPPPRADRMLDSLGHQSAVRASLLGLLAAAPSLVLAVADGVAVLLLVAAPLLAAARRGGLLLVRVAAGGILLAAPAVNPATRPSKGGRPTHRRPCHTRALASQASVRLACRWGELLGELSGPSRLLAQQACPRCRWRWHPRGS